MIIDLPPQVEQLIINQAKSQGMTAENFVKEYLTNFVQNDIMLNSESDGHLTVDNETYHQLLAKLDETPHPTPAMTELMTKYRSLDA